MKKLGTVSAVVLATVLSAVSAQAAEPVRPASSEMTAIYGLPANARVGRVKAKKVSAMSSGSTIAAVGAGAATVGLIWALTDNGNGKQSSPGGN